MQTMPIAITNMTVHDHDVHAVLLVSANSSRHSTMLQVVTKTQNGMKLNTVISDSFHKNFSLGLGIPKLKF